MPLQTSCKMLPIEIEQKATASFLLTRLVGTGQTIPRPIEKFITIYVRLIDKAIQEYNRAYQLIQEEVNEQKRPVKELEKGRFLYYPYIVNEFENCINTANRAMRIFEKLYKHPDTPFSVQKTVRKYSNAIGIKLRDIRNIAEHVDEAIIKGEIKDGRPVSIDISEDASYIIIGDLYLSISDLAALLKKLHELALEITIYNANTDYEKKFNMIADKTK